MSPVHRVLAIPALFLVVAPPAAGAGWEPLPGEMLATEDCPTEPGCRAAVLLEEQELDNEYGHARVSVRRVVKVFKQEGLDLANVKVRFVVGDWSVKDLRGRTIRPDGSVSMLDPYSTIEETLVKRRGYWRKALSFQMPGVEVGAILEYYYTLVYQFQLAGYVFDIQESIPVLQETVTVLPGEVSYRPNFLNLAAVRQDTDEKGRTRFAIRNVPSLKEEPLMPPQEEVRGRFVLYPTRARRTPYAVGKGFHEYLDKYYGRSSKARKLVGEVVGEASTPEDKIQRIYRWIQENLENTSYQESPEGEVVEEQNLYVDDVIRKGQGSAWDLTRLFVFLARHSGLEAEGALVATRDEVFFRPDIWLPGDMVEELAAVRLEGQWRFYDPGTRYCPVGMVSWEKEGIAPNAVVAGEKGGSLIRVEPSRAQDNLLQRTFRVKLDPAGGFTAEAAVEAHGLAGVELRNYLDDLTPEDRVKFVTEDLGGVLHDVEIDEFEMTNLDTWDEPLRLRYRFRAEQFAEPAGGRLLVPAGFLHQESDNPFLAETRTHPIHYQRTGIDVDVVRFQIPEGFEIETLPNRRRKDIQAIRFETDVTAGPDEVEVRREMKVDILLVEPENYEVVRDLYTIVGRVDRSQIVLRMIDSPAAQGEAGR